MVILNLNTYLIGNDNSDAGTNTDILRGDRIIFGLQICRKPFSPTANANNVYRIRACVNQHYRNKYALIEYIINRVGIVYRLSG